MSIYIGLDRIKTAVLRLFDWRGKVKQQTTAHLFPLLALVEKGVRIGTYTRFEEADDFAFFDRYLKVPGDADRPYFDPMTRSRRIATHPHSNIATARKNTFANRWKAGETRDGPADTHEWSLSADFAEIVRDQVLTKAGVTYRPNALDVAVWLLRDDDFPDAATSDDLLARFKERFPLPAAAFDMLFEYRAEPRESIFASVKPSQADIAALVAQLELREAGAPLALPTPTTPPTGVEPSKLPPDDPILDEVRALLGLGTSGIILRGAPGTGKSWYAHQIALAVTNGKQENIFRLQFHPSFTYEDFFDGFVPDESTKSGFKVTGKTLRKALEKAQGTSETVVLLIDEINRGDTSRIFGEALTYIEQGWRGVEFTPKFGGPATSVPGNLLFLATMNPHDRSITQLDMALLRRFDHIDVPPSPERVSDFLTDAGMSAAQAEEVKKWFLSLQRLMPFGLGHTFFLNVGDVSQLGLIWRYRILPFCEAILEFEAEKLEGVRRSFDALDARLRGAET
jgi:5-methylcytosine-specific restriction enzyme B